MKKLSFVTEQHVSSTAPAAMSDSSAHSSEQLDDRVQKLSLSSLLIKLVDYFIADDAAKSADSDELFRFRLMCSLLIIYVLMLIGAATAILLLNDLSEQNRFYGLLIMIPLGTSFIGVLTYFKLTAHFMPCVHALVLMVHMSAVVGVCLSGGPAVSGAMLVAVLPAILAFCLGGRRVGLTWFYFSLLTYTLMIYAQLNGVEYIQTHATAAIQQYNFIFDWSIAFFSTVGLVYVYETMHERLKTERDIEHQRYVRLARYDTLTNIPNRFMFNEHLEQALLRSERSELKTGLLYIDLDGFKPINDQVGHMAGDQALKEIAARLAMCLRKTDLLARLGGDEFAFILEGLNSQIEATVIADKVLEVIAKPLESLDSPFSVTASVGIAFYPDQANNKEELVNRADKAMYAAKQKKNRWAIYG